MHDYIYHYKLTYVECMYVYPLSYSVDHYSFFIDSHSDVQYIYAQVSTALKFKGHHSSLCLC